MRRSQTLNAFQESGFDSEVIDGKISSPLSERGQMSRRTSSAWRERGASRGSRVLVRSAGMRQSAFSKRISSRRAPRAAHFARPREAVGAKLKRRADRRPAVEAVDRGARF
jgi:hypothetical protein